MNSESANLFRSRVVSLEDVDPTTLELGPSYKGHTESGRAALRAVLNQIGWINAVNVSVDTRRVLSGRLRVEEAIKAGEATIPVRWLQLTEAEEAIVAATFDTVGAMAVADRDQLAKAHQEVYHYFSGDLAAALEDQRRAAGVVVKKPSNFVYSENPPKKEKKTEFNLRLKFGHIKLVVRRDDFTAWFKKTFGENYAEAVIKIRKKLGLPETENGGEIS